MEASKAKFKCSKCGVSFLFENTLLLHKQNIHKNSELNIQLRTMESKVQEKIGGEISIVVAAPVVSSPPLSTSREDFFHLKTRPGRKASSDKCDECSLTSRDPLLLLEHIRLEHRAKPVPVFHCGYPTCWFPFPSKARREEHEKTQHGHLAPPPFFCRICRKRFSQWGPGQRKHYELCSKRVLYRCPALPGCPYTKGKRYADLRKHLELVHGDTLARYRRDQYEWRAGEEVVKQEKIEVKTEEYYEEEGGKGEASPPLGRHLCPFDGRRFNTTSQLHLHLHSNHLDTGVDSLDCPLGRDSLTCFCGRKTNCRHSLVGHVSRCEVNNAADSVRSTVVVVEDNKEARRLATSRRAARRLKELGIKGSSYSQQERLRRDQMRACQQIIGLDQQEEEEEEEEEEGESQVDLTLLAPVKRKSCGGVLDSQPRKHLELVHGDTSARYRRDQYEWRTIVGEETEETTL